MRMSYNNSVSRSCPLLSARILLRSGHGTPLFSRRSLFIGGWFHPPIFNLLWRCIDINTELQVNEEIRDREVRVIGADGAQLGILPTRRALELAEEAGLDLVKIVPNAQPPVCKLIDYDKHRYEQAKRERELRKNQKVVAIKEVQLSATIGENDVAIKAKNAIKFLQDGDKVKVSIRFRGRQITHSDIGMQVMNDFIERTKDVCTVERRPMIEGRHMLMILAPKAEKASNAERIAKAAQKAAQA